MTRSEWAAIERAFVDEMTTYKPPRTEGRSVTGFFADAEAEYQRARSKHKPMQSRHEALAVIWEEFEELKAEVFKKAPDPDCLLSELVQIAAMCRAFATEVI